MVEMKQISRAVGSRVPRDRTAGRSPRDRRHPADMGSVARKPENFACKNAQKGNCPKMQFSSFGVFLRALSGASCDASEEVSVFRPPPMSGQGKTWYADGESAMKKAVILPVAVMLCACTAWAFSFDGAKAAAAKGDAAAQCQMGLFYMNGIGVDRDEDKAVEWLKKAAAQNHAQAQYNLGIYYAKFTDKEAVRLAVKWLKAAVKQDYADAQFNLAQLYLNPHHPASRERDAGRLAIALLRRAAAKGHAAAKAKLEELGCTAPQSQERVEELRQVENATFINNAF